MLDIKQARRRLSVMSDNKLIEGVENISLEEEKGNVSYIIFIAQFYFYNNVSTHKYYIILYYFILFSI